MAAEVLAATFIGFALTLLSGAALVDLIGMRRMLLFSAFGYFLGSAMVVAASIMAPTETAYWVVYFWFAFNRPWLGRGGSGDQPPCCGSLS